MRDIIFRGKSDRGPWVYGSLIKTGTFCCVLEEDDGTNYDYPYLDGDLGCIDGYATPIDPETICQFTGKFDTKGQRIFEGDIVYAKMDYGPGGYFDTIIPIAFEEACGGYEWQYFDMETVRVVGNIYDNPAMLKGGYNMIDILKGETK